MFHVQFEKYGTEARSYAAPRPIYPRRYNIDAEETDGVVRSHAGARSL